MILDIDAGNSAIKWRISHNGSVLEESVSYEAVERVLTQLIDAENKLCAKGDNELRVRVSSVQDDKRAALIEQWVFHRWQVRAEFAKTAAKTGAIVNSYVDPSAMGVDRWLAILAACDDALESSATGLRSHCCIVDAGTALTLDFVDENCRHRGGYIVPGLALQLDALRQNTAKVFFSDDRSNHSLLPGTSTEEAVRHGILMQIVSFIEASIASYQKEYAGAKVSLYLTGGDSGLLQDFSDLHFVVRKNLVLDGLSVLLP